MFVSRSFKCGHNWKSLPLNQFLFLIIILQMNEVLAKTDLLGTTTTNGTMCNERWTCSSCTDATMPLCSWLVAEQMCADNTAVKVQSRMVVTNGSSCPKFSVNNRVNALDGNQIITATVTVDDWDMGGGFVHLLTNSSVMCHLGKIIYKAKVDDNRISCSWESKRKSLYNTRCQQLVPHYNHLSIVFDGKLLRFDNVSNHYLTTYPGAGDCLKMECPHCDWNNGTHRFYCSMCSVKNTTSTDIIPYCDVRNISSLLYLGTTNIRNDERCSSKGPGVINYSVTPKMIFQSELYFNPGSGSSQVGNNSSPVHPTLDDGQVFGGIESGGTTFWVHGQHFSGLRKVKCCVKHRYWCGNCDVRNDTHMVCRTPKIKIDLEDAFENEYLRFYAEKSIGIEYKLKLPDLDYQRYHDPVFTDFVVDGCCNVNINGLYLDKGFTAEDLSIILVGESSSSRCQITSLDSTQIICKVSQSSSSQLGPLPKQLNVTIGGNLNVVKLSKQKYYFKRSWILWPGIVTIGAYVSFIAVIWVVLVFFKDTKEYDLLHLHGHQQLAEMRLLDERNLNDYDDNGKPENMLLARDE